MATFDDVDQQQKPRQSTDVHDNQKSTAATSFPKPLRRLDSLDIESAKVGGHHDGHATRAVGWVVILQLAFQSIGVVYGDIGTSPLYVYASTFTDGIKHKDDILGVLSLIYYTFTLLPVVKYVFIVLRANDNGNGGTFALYSLICRHVKVGLLPSQQAEDKQVSNYRLELPSRRLDWSLKVKNALENSHVAKYTLLFVTMLAVSLVIGDGILTPAISVLSATGGIKAATTKMTDGMVVWLSVVILVLLFSVQRFGTDKVGYSFAPIVCSWLSVNAGMGLYNFVKYDPSVIKAVNPAYIVQYFERNGRDAWVSLGGVVLCVTGLEALFADLGHFTVRSIQISLCSIVYPALMMTYTGQASYLRHFPENVSDTFFKCIPGPLYWPVFLLAIMAAIVASQAMISGTFSIIQQSLSLGCFPRVTVVHTSAKFEGQVYIPELNYVLMVGCVCVTLAFKTTENIGHAYGIAVVFAETITSTYVVLVLILIWKKHILLVISYILIIMSVELTYLSSVLYKFTHGGYLPLAFACVLMLVMYIWNYVYRKRYHYELDHKVSADQLRDLTSRPNLARIPGMAIFYSELVHGIPPIFEHYAANIPALHSVVVFAAFKSLPVNKVPAEERFLFRRVVVCGCGFQVYRCVVRYGYTDVRNERESFEKMLVERLVDFIREESFVRMLIQSSSGSNGQIRQQKVSDRERSVVSNVGGEETRDQEEEEENNSVDGIVDGRSSSCNNDATAAVEEERRQREMEEEIEGLHKAARAGVVHLVGESEVVSAKGSSLMKKVVVDYWYNFIRRNLRQGDKMLDIPHRRLLKVGMTYEL